MIVKRRIARRAAKAWIELGKGLQTTDTDTPEYDQLHIAESRIYDWLAALPESLKADLRKRYNIQI